MREQNSVKEKGMMVAAAAARGEAGVFAALSKHVVL